MYEGYVNFYSYEIRKWTSITTEVNISSETVEKVSIQHFSSLRI